MDADRSEPCQGVEGKKLDALLCVMPFGLVELPSLALGLLQAAVERSGATAESRYFNVSFAKAIGADDYGLISRRLFPYGIHEVGQWLFSGALFPQADLKRDEYIEKVLRQASRPLRPQVLPEEVIRSIQGVREQVEPFLERCVEETVVCAPGLVGLSCGPNQRVPSLAFARMLKARSPGTFIVFGGQDCEGEMGAEIVRQFPFVDAVVFGPGELALPEILARRAGGRPVEGIPGVYTQHMKALPPQAHFLQRPGCEPDVDLLPFPDYEDYFNQLEECGEGLNGPPYIAMETARGCWWDDSGRKCTFCSESPGRLPFRSKSPDRALAELREVATRYRPSKIFLVDRALDPAYFESVLPAMARQPLPADVFLTLRATVTKEQVRALRDAGVRSFTVGIESLSTPVLKAMCKGTTELQNLQVLRWAKTYGLSVCWNLLWGFPGEPAEEYQRMARLVPRIAHLTPPNVATQIVLMRFSPLFDRAEELGLADVASAPAYSYLYPFDPDTVARLAFYFAYGYQTPRDVDAYTDELAEAVRDWQRLHGESELIVVDDGDRAFVRDDRPGAGGRVTVLTGLPRLFLHSCDRIQNVGKLHQIAVEAQGRSVARDELDDALQTLERSAFVVSEGHRWLSLAIPVEIDPTD